MLEPGPFINITVLIDKPCWKDPRSQWESLVRSAVLETFRQSSWDKEGEVNILLTDDAALQDLNKQYRGCDKPTNVLSFPSLEPEDFARLSLGKDHPIPLILGDVALAFQTLERESLNQGKPFDHHFMHLVVHGVLHLLGFDHEEEDDATLMESLEIKILSSLMIPNPYEER